MDENLFDITLLLGCDFALRTLNTSSLCHVLLMNYNKSTFFDTLTSMLTEFLKFTDYDGLANQLGLSKYLLELIISYDKSSGYCNICSRYFFSVSNHLKCSHSLNIDLIAMHSSLFSKRNNVFMPKDYKKQENHDHLLVHPQEKTFKKSKIAFKPVTANGSTNISTHVYDIATSSVCKECGKQVPLEKKNYHSSLHKRNKVVECPNCSKEMRRRYFSDHYRNCRIG